MSNFLQYTIIMLLGFILVCYGLTHAVVVYPAPAVFSHLIESLPMLGAVLSFALGVAFAVAGLVMLAVAVHRLRRPRPKSIRIMDGSTVRVSPPRRRQPDGYDEQIEPGEEFEFPDYPAHYPGNDRHGNGGRPADSEARGYASRG